MLTPYLANSTDKRVLGLQLCIVVSAREVKNTPALGALQHRAGTVTVVTVPVVVSHSLHIFHTYLYQQATTHASPQMLCHVNIPYQYKQFDCLITSSQLDY